MATIDAAEILVRALEREGVRAMFAIADISYAPVLRSAKAHGIRIVGGRHESAEVHMADGWARATGEVAVAMAGMGPGVANLVPAVVTAWIEGTPLVVVATQRTRRAHLSVRRGRFQYTPQIDLVRHVTKYADDVPDGRHMAEFVQEAFRCALSGRPGPVYLEICDDILREEVDEAELRFAEPARYRVAPAGPDPEQVVALADRLVHAERPLVLAGSGVERAEGADALAEVAERLGALVMSSLGARGVFDEDDPKSVIINSPGGSEAAKGADLVLAVGTQIGEILGHGRPPRWGDYDRQHWVQIDIDPGSIGVNREVELGVVADAGTTLRALAGELRKRDAARSPSAEAARWARSCHGSRQEMREAFGGSNAVPMHPGRLVREVADFLPHDARIAFDGGNTAVWSHLMNRFRRPRSLLWTSHFGHLGTGLPYAIGAKLADPDRPTFLLTGDGALGFNVQELETAAREGVRIVCVVSCDFAWGMESAGLSLEIGEPIGVATSPIRYDRIARGFGCHGELVEAPDDVRPALERAYAADGPAVVQALVDPRANANPPGLLEFAQMYAAADG